MIELTNRPDLKYADFDEDNELKSLDNIMKQNIASQRHAHHCVRFHQR